MISSMSTAREAKGKALALGLLFVAALMAMMLLATKPAHAETIFIVTNTNDSGAGSLPQAILDANAAVGADTIIFNIPASDPNRSATTGVFTITPTSALPTINSQVTIDGYTQGDGTPADSSDDATPNTQAVGNDARLLIELSGASAGSFANGLKITAGMSTVKGLVINRFAQYGILLDGSTATNNRVEGNFIGTRFDGTRPAGAPDLGNSAAGVGLNQSAGNNIIGGTDPAARNVISDNSQAGVHINSIGGGAAPNLVQGNYIGTNAAGNAALGNTSHGVYLSSGNSTTTVGGTAAGAGNLISGNQYGVYISGGSGTDAKVQGNYIGTNAAGNAALGNTSHGVYIPSNSANNVTVGGTDPAARNVISGNGQSGVHIGSVTGTKVQGNYIGTDAGGSADLGNSLHGVLISGAFNTTVGGTDPAARNIISGNNQWGVGIANTSGGANLVQGNYIGTDAGGSADLGNSLDGVVINFASGETIGGRTAGAGNVISGNDRNGILISSAGNHRIEGNFIGTKANGTDPLGNSQHGIDISSSHNNAVGGARTGAANVIAFNGNDGVSVIFSGTANRILSNSIYSNGTAAGHLGIDLRGNDGVTANDPGDADTGSNRLQNFPVLNSAERTDVDGSTTITGTLNSTPDEVFTIQFFASPSADHSNHGEGKTYLGQKTDVTTDLSGNAAFSFTTQVSTRTQVVSAIATATPDNDTSEFSAARAVTEVNDPPVNTVPGAQSTNEDTALVFSQANDNRISISDPDAGSSSVEVRLQVDHGTLTLGSTAGLTFAAGDSGANDADMTFTGSLADVNAALGGLRFDPDSHYNGGATLSIATNDQGNTGAGGPKTDTDTVNITLTSVNDAPSFTKGPNQIVQDKAGTQSVPNWATNISVGPPDESSAQSLQFIVTSDNDALFTTTGRPAVSSVGTLTYTPAVNANGTATVQVVARDSGGTANVGDDDTSDAQSFTITVNDATAPRIKNTTPTNGMTGVSPNANVIATFSEAMKASTINGDTFTLKTGTTKIQASVFVDPTNNRRWILDPSTPLARGTTYVATVTAGAQDLAGNALDQNPNTAGNQSKVWRFTTRI